VGVGSTALVGGLKGDVDVLADRGLLVYIIDGAALLESRQGLGVRDIVIDVLQGGDQCFPRGFLVIVSG
jgi:hypothetical protein